MNSPMKDDDVDYMSWFGRFVALAAMLGLAWYIISYKQWAWLAGYKGIFFFLFFGLAVWAWVKPIRDLIRRL